jgi:hypothetical protein
MVNLFKDIPEEQIAVVLENIRRNLEKVNLHDGHTIQKHVDIQLGILKTRLTAGDIRYATSFYDFEVAAAAVQSMLKQYYEEKIATWLLSVTDDVLVLTANLNSSIGYGYRRDDDRVHEGLSKMRLILEKEETLDWGFRILTCFPIF